MAAMEAKSAQEGQFPGRDEANDSESVWRTGVEVEFIIDWNCAKKGDRRTVQADCAVVWEEQGIAKRVPKPPMNKMVQAPEMAK